MSSLYFLERKVTMAFNFKRGVKRITKYLNTHQSGILAGSACVGVVITAVVAVKCHTKAEDILGEAYDDLEVVYNDFDNEEISAEECDKRELSIRVDCARALAITYAPAVISGVLTITSIVMSHKSHLRHEAMLTTALNGATALLSDYKDEAKALLKPKQYEEIEHKVAEKQVKRKPVPSEDMIYSTGLGNQLMRIEKTGLYVRISEDELNKILYSMIECNAINEEYATYNDLEWALCRIQTGDGASWIWTDDMFKSGEHLTSHVTYTNYIDPRTGAKESIGLVKFSIEPRLMNPDAWKPSARM